jgi:hypothetical protein
MNKVPDDHQPTSRVSAQLRAMCGSSASAATASFYPLGGAVVVFFLCEMIDDELRRRD